MFATLPLPDVEAALDELAYALDTLHADGIVLYSNYAGIYLGDSHFDPLFAELDRRATVVFLHPTMYTGSALPSARNAGSPISTLPGFMLEFVFDTTRAVANLVLTGTLKRHPRVRINLSHAGGTVPCVAHKLVSGGLWMTFAPLLSAAAQAGTQAEVGAMLALPPDQAQVAIGAFETDIFAQLRTLYYDTALSANRQVFGSLQQLAPTAHILLGMDYPFAPEVESGATLQRLDRLASLSEQERQDIASYNALTLFPRFQH